MPACVLHSALRKRLTLVLPLLLLLMARLKLLAPRPTRTTRRSGSITSATTVIAARNLRRMNREGGGLQGAPFFVACDLDGTESKKPAVSGGFLANGGRSKD